MAGLVLSAFGREVRKTFDQREGARMTTEPTLEKTTENADPTESLIPFHDDDGRISRDFLEAVEEAIVHNDASRMRSLTVDLHDADLADLLEVLSADDRSELIAVLGKDFDFSVLTEVDDSIRLRVLEDMEPEEVAEGVRELESDDAVYLLEDLEDEDKDDILARIPVGERIPLQRSLDYPEDSAGRRMQSEFIAVPPFWTVGQTIDFMRDTEDLPDEFYEVYVVDPSYRLVGRLALDKLLRAQRPTPIQDILHESLHPVGVMEDQEEVARTFERYDLVSTPVIDESERMVGVLTVDDIVDVIQEEAEEDLRRLSGVGDEEMSDSVYYTARSRFTWLFINLFTALLASTIINVFDGTIEQMVALAVLMPIVASLGGNAATQSMTVAVRALATKDLGSANMGRMVSRELLVGALNGMLLAIIIGAVAGFWFANPDLGVVIASAMIVNMICAGFFGIVIPVTMDKFDVDPAIASGVFVTMVTDVVGFFAFLGLAAWWFGLY